MIRGICAFCLVMAAVPVSAQIYKCTENGKTTYSQQPCSTGAAGRTLQPPPERRTELSPDLKRVQESTFTSTLEERRAELERQLEELKAERETRRQAWLAENPRSPERIRFAVKHGLAEIGMDQSAALASLGYPDDQRRHTFAGGTAEWWYYEQGSRRLALHFTNGKVDSIHD